MKKVTTFIFILFVGMNLSYSTIYRTSYDGNNSPPVYIDVDLDGDHDFYFDRMGNNEHHVFCSKPSSYFAAEGSSGSLPKAYSENSGMGTYHWQNGNGLLASLSSGGYFSETNQYLMVKFSNGSKTLYGWFTIRYYGLSLYIVSYAYNDIQNEMIAPGEISCSAKFDYLDFKDGEISFLDKSEPSPTTYSWASPLSYSWDFGDGETSTDKDPSHTFTTNGSFNVCLTVTNKFNRSSKYCEIVKITYIPTGIEATNNIGITLTPNPTSGEIKFHVGNWKLRKVEMIDINGRIYTLKYQQTPQGETVLDISSLAKGLYLCKLTNANGTVISNRIIKD